MMPETGVDMKRCCSRELPEGVGHEKLKAEKTETPQ